MQITSLNKNVILNNITQEQIFKYYCPNFRNIGVKFCSEFRQDPNPSAIISPYNGRLLYKDFGESVKSCDCFSYVMRKYNISFNDVIEMIARDFNIVPSNISLDIKKEITVAPIETDYKQATVKFEFKTRNYYSRDMEYWGQYNLTIDILKFFDVHPVQWLRVIKNNKSILVHESTIYVYIIDSNVYKFLFPYNTERKWLTNKDSTNVYQGFRQLPLFGDTLIITKSLKDVMVLYKYGYNAIAVAGESVIIEYEFVQKLYKRFNKIYLFFDNDLAGRKGSGKNAKKLQLEEKFIDNSFISKDISDFNKLYGDEETLKYLISLFGIGENNKENFPF